MSSSPLQREWVVLIERFINGDMDDASGSRLARLLATQPRARRYYVEAMDVHASLQWQCSAAQAQHFRPAAVELNAAVELMREVLEQEAEAKLRRLNELEAESRRQTESDDAKRFVFEMAGAHAPRVRHIVIPRPLVYGVAAGIAAMLVLLVYAWLPPRESQPATVIPPRTELVEAPTPAPTPATRQAVAHIIASVNAQWAGASAIEHEPLFSDEALHLTGGMVKLRFATGAEVILRAPVEFVPIAGNELRLVRGELVGRCLIDSARGFAVQTDNARVVDLGTEFGVRVTASGATEAHVFEGEVMLSAMTEGDAKLSLKGGMAGRVNPEGTRVVATGHAPHTFVAEAEFEANVLAEEGSAYHRVVAHRYAMMRRPDLLAYYTFEQDTMRDGAVMNQAQATHGSLEAVLTGAPEGARPRIVAGRFAREYALDFMPRGSEIVWARVEHDAAFESLEQMTIAAWVWRAPHDGGTIVSKRGGDKDVAFQMSLFGPTRFGSHRNVMQFGSGQAKALDQIFYHSQPIAQPLTGWRFVVAAYEGGEVRFYLDGRPIDRGRITAPVGHSSAPLLIGAAPMTLTGIGADPFQGSIDEVAIFSRALSDAEIAALYEASAP